MFFLRSKLDFWKNLSVSQAILPTSNASMLLPKAKRVPKGNSQPCMASWWPKPFQTMWKMDRRDACIQPEINGNEGTCDITRLFKSIHDFCNPANKPTWTGITSSCCCACSCRSALTSKPTTRRSERKKGTKISGSQALINWWTDQSRSFSHSPTVQKIPWHLKASPLEMRIPWFKSQSSAPRPWSKHHNFRPGSSNLIPAWIIARPRKGWETIENLKRPCRK